MFAHVLLQFGEASYGTSLLALAVAGFSALVAFMTYRKKFPSGTQKSIEEIFNKIQSIESTYAQHVKDDEHSFNEIAQKLVEISTDIKWIKQRWLDDDEPRRRR